MSPLVWTLVAVAVGAALLWRLLGGGLDRDIARALALKDTAALVDRLDKVGAATRPDAYNRAIKRLWDGYERALALQLVRRLAELHRDCRIAQYWLSQAQSVEPGLSRQFLDPQFLEAHYQPQVAATCGHVG